MPKQVNYIKDMVDKYTTGEIVAFLNKGLSECIKQMSSATKNQNLAEFGNTAATLGQVWMITKALDVKLNGEKPTEVL